MGEPEYASQRHIGPLLLVGSLGGEPPGERATSSARVARHPTVRKEVCTCTTAGGHHAAAVHLRASPQRDDERARGLLCHRPMTTELVNTHHDRYGNAFLLQDAPDHQLPAA